MTLRNFLKTVWFIGILNACLHSFKISAGEKIATLIPTWGETLEALLVGSEHRLVGVSEATHRRDSNIPFISDHVKVYREYALKLKPTLWIKDRHSAELWGLKETITERSRVVELNARNWREFIDSVREIGKILGLEKKAEELLFYANQEIHEVENAREKWLRVHQVPPQRLLRIGFLIDVTERRVAGKNTIIEDIFYYLGVENAFAGVEGYPRVQQEWITKQKPDRLLESYSDSVDKRYEGIFKMGLNWPKVLRSFQQKFYADQVMVHKP